jgi:hypothetical protein
MQSAYSEPVFAADRYLQNAPAEPYVAEIRRMNAQSSSKSIDDLNNAAFRKWKRLKNTEAKIQRKMARKRMGCVGRVDPYDYKMYITHAEKKARNTKKKVSEP